jgi:chloride channel protein, CIC family
VNEPAARALVSPPAAIYGRVSSLPESRYGSASSSFELAMALNIPGRHVRRARVLSGRWQRRAVFFLGGIAVGAAAVALAYLADRAQFAFAELIGRWRFASLIVTPLGFALSVYATRQFFPNSQGSGIPQAIAARQLTDRSKRSALVSFRIGIGKVLLTLLGLIC